MLSSWIMIFSLFARPNFSASLQRPIFQTLERCWKSSSLLEEIFGHLRKQWFSKMNSDYFKGKVCHNMLMIILLLFISFICMKIWLTTVLWLHSVHNFVWLYAVKSFYVKLVTGFAWCLHFMRKHSKVCFPQMCAHKLFVTYSINLTHATDAEWKPRSI